MQLEKQYGFEVYPKREVTVVKGQGALLWDDQDNQYIDCAGGIGVANVGHANAAVAEAIYQQAQTLITCPGIFYNDTRGKLVEKLVSISPPKLNRVFLCNSGTEAMEAALKFARISTGKSGFISAMRGFHGRTMGALSATFKYRDEFEPLISGHRFVPFNNFDKLTQAVDENTAAIVLEVVQGEGGVRPADAEYLKAVRLLCDQKEILLILDEIQTGFGRTGKMFAAEHYAVSADIMTVAKAMAGGIPMGAVLCADNVSSALGKHGSTFGGNPLACAASLATIDYIESHDLVSRAQANGLFLNQQLREKLSSGVREIRQLGLMAGIELKFKSKPIIESLLQKGVMALPAGPTVLRLLPPLVIEKEQLEHVVEMIRLSITENS